MRSVFEFFLIHLVVVISNGYPSCNLHSANVLLPSATGLGSNWLASTLLISTTCHSTAKIRLVFLIFDLFCILFILFKTVSNVSNYISSEDPSPSHLCYDTIMIQYYITLIADEASTLSLYISQLLNASTNCTWTLYPWEVQIHCGVNMSSPQWMHLTIHLHEP